jgi:putative hydrolase of the HAD superfamily
MSPATREPRGSTAAAEPVELVLLDVGGPVYDDACYASALRRAAGELAGAPIDEAAFAAVYEKQRRAQRGGLRTAVARAFVPGEDRAALSALAARYWEYPAGALHADVVPALDVLADRYRLALVANQRAHVMEALRRDGLADRFDVIALSEVVGVEKPDPAIFRYALERTGVPATRAVHVGNRLDTDVRPARKLGLRTVWVLRGEAPAQPTEHQLAEADAAIRSLAELPAALAGLEA